MIITRDVKLDFFSKSKLESKKSIKTRNSFPVVSYSLTRAVLTNDWQHGQENQNKYVVRDVLTFVPDEWRWQSIRWHAGKAERAPRPPVMTWWVDCSGPQVMEVSKSVRHVGQGTLGMWLLTDAITHYASQVADWLYDRSGDGKHCHKTAWGMHCSGLQRDSLGDPLFATRVQSCRRAGDSDETPPIDLLLLYCGRRPTVFSRFLVHQSNESNVQLCSISEQNFSEHSFAV